MAKDPQAQAQFEKAAEQFDNHEERLVKLEKAVAYLVKGGIIPPL